MQTGYCAMSGAAIINTSGFQLYPDITSENGEETRLLKADAKEALAFVRGFKWAPPVKRLYLAWGVGGIVVLFLVIFERKIAGAPDDRLWIVVGDLPPAYFVTESVSNPAEAIDAYCGLMEDWIWAVRNGGDVSECYPVGVPPDEEHAAMIDSRISSIRAHLLPRIHQFIGGRDSEYGKATDDEAGSFEP
ncbi:MAG TPA: hypothetical protein VMU59_11380 [Caulobacteraceae bacterium]|nr:hypothetical protein [Caulobacteraceae bacterium]